MQKVQVSPAKGGCCQLALAPLHQQRPQIQVGVGGCELGASIDRTRDNGFKLHEGGVRLDIRKKMIL